MRTDRICDNTIFVEINEEWVDMGNIYITDSVNFRVHVIRFDPGHESFDFKCKGDSLIVYKTYLRKEVLKRFSIKDLKQNGKL